MFAVQLTTGQSIATREGTFSVSSGFLVVVISEQEHQSLDLSSYSDISQPDLDIISLTLPSSPGTICAGRFVYCGFSCSASANAGFVLSDSSKPQIIESVAILAGDSKSYFYGTLNSSQMGLGVAGNLVIGNISGTYAGVVRIGSR
jgi:hypothetical protein